MLIALMTYPMVSFQQPRPEGYFVRIISTQPLQVFCFSVKDASACPRNPILLTKPSHRVKKRNDEMNSAKMLNLGLALRKNVLEPTVT